MAERIVKMWFDPVADFLEVVFEQKNSPRRVVEATTARSKKRSATVRMTARRNPHSPILC